MCARLMVAAGHLFCHLDPTRYVDHWLWRYFSGIYFPGWLDQFHWSPKLSTQILVGQWTGQSMLQTFDECDVFGQWAILFLFSNSEIGNISWLCASLFMREAEGKQAFFQKIKRIDECERPSWALFKVQWALQFDTVSLMGMAYIYLLFHAWWPQMKLVPHRKWFSSSESSPSQGKRCPGVQRVHQKVSKHTDAIVSTPFVNHTEDSIYIEEYSTPSVSQKSNFLIFFCGKNSLNFDQLCKEKYLYLLG